jgi:hypothetical protein
VEAAAADCQILACKEIKITIQIFQGKIMHLKGESQKILEYFLGSWKINSVLSVGPLMGFYIYLFRSS